MPDVLRGEQTSGVYPLATYPGCLTPHHGQYEGQGVLVVARGSVELERLFRFTKLAEASTYARDINALIESLPSAAICDEAVIDLYG